MAWLERKPHSDGGTSAVVRWRLRRSRTGRMQTETFGAARPRRPPLEGPEDLLKLLGQRSQVPIGDAVEVVDQLSEHHDPPGSGATDGWRGTLALSIPRVMPVIVRDSSGLALLTAASTCLSDVEAKGPSTCAMARTKIVAHPTDMISPSRWASRGSHYAGSVRDSGASRSAADGMG
jgi:hypothetical protein